MTPTRPIAARSPMSATSGIALVAALVLATGCARRPEPAPAAPPPVPSGTPHPSASDTAYDRASHVYPEGESAIARKLLKTIADPDKVDASPAPRSTTPSGSGSGSASPPGAGAGAGAGCWEVQLLSTTDSNLASSVRRDGADRLGVPVRIVEHAGFQKVRAGDCLSSSAALALAERARSEGFSGAFRAPSLP